MIKNEKWQGGSKSNQNPGAGRDGKNYEKRDVKSILKGSRGATRFTNDRESNSDEQESRPRLEFKKRDDSRPSSYGERKSYGNNEGRSSYGERKPYGNNEGRSSYGDRKPYGNNEGRSYGDRKPYGNNEGRSSYGDRKPYGNNENRSYGERKPYGNSRPRFNSQNEGGQGNNYRKPYTKRYEENAVESRLSFRKPGEDSPTEYIETRFDNKQGGVRFRKPMRKRTGDYDPNAKYSQKKRSEYNRDFVDPTKPVRLNKFLANAGICSRREADEFIQAGVISVNGDIVSELGVKVLPTDKVMFHNQLVRTERKVYILLNKPKDCVTTAEDTHDRLTVVDLVKNACSERIYPVGRLDRNTTGVILLTNDGDLASRLTHPKYDKKKIYHATLDKPLQKEDFEIVLSGVTLDDGLIAADALEFVKDDDDKQVGIEIHSGQNRVVRRIFEKLGYKVIRLDRVYFAGLTKKNLPRGKYRFLNDREVGMLKMGAYE